MVDLLCIQGMQVVLLYIEVSIVTSHSGKHTVVCIVQSHGKNVKNVIQMTVEGIQNGSLKTRLVVL